MTTYDWIGLIGGIAFWVAIGLISAWIAQKKHRAPLKWGLAGAFSLGIAAGAIVLLKDIGNLKPEEKTKALQEEARILRYILIFCVIMFLGSATFGF
jgi:hypothetical protein